MSFKKIGPLNLTDKCHHYEDISEVPWDLQKYWHQRNSLFQDYDYYPIHLTDDAWFGVTPEPIANQIASDLLTISPPHKTTIIDLFGGVGGNLIAFAQHPERWHRIIAIEKDQDTIACAMNNAEVYGVGDRITWVLGDCFDFLAAYKDKKLEVEVDDDLILDKRTTTIFASPPWGGVSYRDHDIFDLTLMEPYNLEKLAKACEGWEYTLYLPRTSDLRQIAKLAPGNKKIEVVQYCMEGASKALVAYVPEEEDGETTTG